VQHGLLHRIQLCNIQAHAVSVAKGRADGGGRAEDLQQGHMVVHWWCEVIGLLLIGLRALHGV
jgi:hypothetical protein